MSSQTRVLLRFAALERVMRRACPSRNRDTLISFIRFGRPIGMSTCNHNGISHIYLWLPVIAFTFPFSDKREEADDVVPQPIPSIVLPNSHPFPRLRPRPPPIQNSCRLHKNTLGWSSSSRDGTWTSRMDVRPRGRAQQKPKTKTKNDSLPERPVHNVFYMTDCPAKFLRSGRRRNRTEGGHPSVERGGSVGAKPRLGNLEWKREEGWKDENQKIGYTL